MEKFKKVLETTFIRDNHRVAHILEDDIVIQMFIVGQFFNRKECFDDIKTYRPGWVQSTESAREAIRTQTKSGANDYYTPINDLYDELIAYAKNKYGDQFKIKKESEKRF